jgi:hypothetical protein
MHTTSKGSDMTSLLMKSVLLTEAVQTLENYPTDVFMGMGLTRQPLSEIHPRFVAPAIQQHVLYIQDLDDSVIRWDTAPDTPANLELLERRAYDMYCTAWVTTEAIER